MFPHLICYIQNKTINKFFLHYFIDAQLQNLRSYCKRQLFSVIKEYSITESSTRGDRKKFTEMLSFVKQQKTKVIIVANYNNRNFRFNSLKHLITNRCLSLKICQNL